jgi:YidC/Oxa1 family membrane protein insertase
LNRNTIMAWVLLMGLMLFWTSYKQKQAVAAQNLKHEQQRADSLANVIKSGGSKTADSSVANGGAGSGSQRTDSLHGIKDSALVAHRFLTVETNRFTVKLDNEGAKVAELTLKDLAGHRPYNPEIIPAEGGALALNVDNQDLSKTLWRMDTDAKDSAIHVDKVPVTVTFNYTVPGGKRSLIRTFTFYPDSNKFSQHLGSSEPLNTYALTWQSGLRETEKIHHGKGFGLMTTFFSEVILDNGVNVQRTAFEGKKTFNEESGVLKWVGLRRKYVAALINFNKETTNKVVATGRIQEGEEKTYPKDYQLQIVANNYDDKDLDFDFVVLPLSYDKLKAANQNYEKIIFSGWESFFRADIWYVALCGFILHLLNFFHGIIPNYGVAIILLTLLVRLITFPLTIAQTKQGVKMQQHMPAIAKIREKNKGQPQKANLEIMEYYKKEGVNPLSGVMGCFPVLLQMPIFISLFNVLGRAVELKGAPFALWVHDLALPDVVYDAIKIPYVFPLGITVMPFFMAITMFFQMKLSIKDPNQKMMVWLMPGMMFVFSCAFPSGLVLYWTVSNLFTIGQTYFYTNRLKPAPGKPIVSTVAKPKAR